jgi:hypothetical protein
LRTTPADVPAKIPFAKPAAANIVGAMSTVQEIKSAIDQLPLEERAALIADLCGWTDDEWDRQMKADAAAGRFAAVNEDAATAYQDTLAFLKSPARK